MVRGGRGYPRGGSYRGSRGNHPWNGGGFNKGPRERYNSFDSGYDKGRFNDRFSRDDYSKSYRTDNYSRDRHSPDRKRQRMEGRSRHEYGGGGYDSYPPSERRGYSGGDRHLSSPYGGGRKEEFRRPPPPPSPRGSSRGRFRGSSRGGLRRERGGGLTSRRLDDRSYAIRKRGSMRSRGDFSRRSTKLIRIRSSMIRRKALALSGQKESSSDDDDENETKEPKKEGEDDATEEGGEEGDESAEVKEEKGEDGEGGEAKPKEKEKKAEDGAKKTKSFVTLICPHCNIKAPTFNRYEAHLAGRSHQFSMRKVATKQRSIIAQMRQAQRNAQNELEKGGDGITDHTVFCPLCKLNYKQERAVHQSTAAHKNMKKFLMPTCKVCKKTFKSPMVYEHHLCSVEHLKRKARSETTEEDEEGNLDEFTTIDSVGEVGDEKEGSADEKEKEEKKKKRVVVGAEQIKRIEAYYCDLCRMFLPRGTENEYPDIIAGHCKKNFHLARFVRFKESEKLKKKAEKQKLKAEEKAKEEAAKKETEEGGEEKEGEDAKMDTSKTTDDDKLWDAVDKDLGELLEETDGRDDDDEEANGERFDRFKSAELNGEDGADGQQAADQTTEAEN